MRSGDLDTTGRDVGHSASPGGRDSNTGDMVQALVGLQACQTKGRPAFEREQIAGVAHEVER